jgi:uncharacterized membrane protein YsdA (DUF1294 family)
MVERWIVGFALWALLIALFRVSWDAHREARRTGKHVALEPLLLVVAIALVGGAVGAALPAERRGRRPGAPSPLP